MREDGTVRVTIPRWGSQRDAQAFAESQQAWIEAQVRMLETTREQRREREPDPETARAARDRARLELPARLDEFASALGIGVRRVSVRNQRWRWGSCSRDGHICLNWRLMLLPSPLREYVIIHELMHRKRMDHSPKFWTLVERVLPDWRERRRQLRAYEYLLDARQG